MRIKDYIELNKFSTDNKKKYSFMVLDYFGIDYKDMKVLDVYDKVRELTTIKINENINGKLKINGKWFYIEKDITKSTFGQFIDLESYLNNEDYLINHLNEILSIYVRPRKFKWWKLRYEIEKWDPERREFISKELLNMDINDAFGLNVFFYQNAADSIRNMKIHYLNNLVKMREQVQI